MELQARRAGQTPATNHRPLDFLGPGAVGAASVSEGLEEEDDLEDLRPPPADEAVAQCISAARAAAWLRAAACTDTSTLAEVLSPTPLVTVKASTEWTFMQFSGFCLLRGQEESEYRLAGTNLNMLLCVRTLPRQSALAA